MPNAQSADEDATLTLAHHCVPESRLLAWTLDRVPRGEWLAVIVGQVGIDELGAGSDPPVLSVDEEPRHGAPP